MISSTYCSSYISHDHHVVVYDMTTTRHHHEHIQQEMSSSRLSQDTNKTLLEGSSMSISDFSMMPSSYHDSPLVEMEKPADTGNLISQSINVPCMGTIRSLLLNHHI